MTWSPAAAPVLLGQGVTLVMVLFFMISQSRSPTLFPQKWDKIFQEASIFLNPLLTLIFFQQFVSHSIIAPEALIGSDPA